jgi:eukaryotic-like serine/threonine-protein kinase
LRWKVMKHGYETLEATSYTREKVTGPTGSGRALIFPEYGTTTLNLTLAASGSIPAGMVRIPGGEVTLDLEGFYDLPSVEIPDYWMDRYEVTNKEYKQFVDAGGYQNSAYWKQALVENDRTFSWEKAKSKFLDKTGRPGPATWAARVLSESDVQVSRNAGEGQTPCRFRRWAHPTSRPDDQRRYRLARPLPRAG